MRKQITISIVMAVILLLLVTSFSIVGCSDSINGPKIVPDKGRGEDDKKDREQNNIEQLPLVQTTHRSVLNQK